MSVLDCVPAYEFEPNGPDDLSDVDLDSPAFRAAFPDGVVPIRHVPMPDLYMEEGFFGWAERLLALYDHAHEYDIEALDELGHQLVSFRLSAGNVTADVMRRSRGERRQIVAEMMQRGLTLRQVARFVGWPESDVADAVVEGGARRTESIMHADEVLAVGERPTISELARQCELDRRVVRGLARLRAGLSYRAVA